MQKILLGKYYKGFCLIYHWILSKNIDIVSLKFQLKKTVVIVITQNTDRKTYFNNCKGTQAGIIIPCLGNLYPSLRTSAPESQSAAISRWHLFQYFKETNGREVDSLIYSTCSRVFNIVKWWPWTCLLCHCFVYCIKFEVMSLNIWNFKFCFKCRKTALLMTSTKRLP